ncbi:MAG TPA: hypothetical protein VJ723_10360 [Candidatus Angelobacter sp.]|nr:hypothetical protein [Candidatus Angelobacter sp.]
MNYGRIVLAGVAATVVYFAVGGLVFGKLVAGYYAPYPDVYRSQTAVMHYFPYGIASTLIALIVLAAIYAHGYKGGPGIAEGFRFGLLIGVFIVCAVVADEYVTLNIGHQLALVMAAGRLFGWIIVGVVIGLVYKPRATATR